jgi:hypothetical protein
MDSCLNQPIEVSLPRWNMYSRVPAIPGYTSVSTRIPILERILGTLPEKEGQLQSDEYFARVHSFTGSGECVVETASKKRKSSYCKVTHILDPVRKIQGYYDNAEKGKERIQRKTAQHMNQAYIDYLANYLLGQLRERDISPHFCLFYGGFQAVANRYRYNITESFESYKHYKGFWDKKDRGLFSLYVTEDGESISEEEANLKTYVNTRSFSYSTDKSRGRRSTESSKRSDSSHISLLEYAGAGAEAEEGTAGELESVSTFASGSDNSDTDGSDEGEESMCVYSEFEHFPTVLLFQEKMDGIMDNLLDEVDPDFEEKWTAWTFQVIAALCVSQATFGLTHNDLHTNNILYSKTDQPYIYYRTRDGCVWRVPTYGRILRIIDFGRSVFRVGTQWFVSDDFAKGGDAQAQYSFGDFTIENSPTVYPNPSFDLSRYAVSIMDPLFPKFPAEKEGAKILNEEGLWTVKESVSPLWNLLWTWLIDDTGRNILRDEDGMERFPDFDLYETIAAHVFTAKPQDQIRKEIFTQYSLAPSDVPEGQKVYSLFC